MGGDHEKRVTLVPRSGRQLVFRDGVFVERAETENKPPDAKDKPPHGAAPEPTGDGSDGKPKKPGEDPAEGGIYPPYWPIHVGSYLVYNSELKNARRFPSLRALNRELPDLAAKLKSTESKLAVAVEIQSPMQLQELKELTDKIGVGKHLIILVEPTSGQE